MPHRGAGPTTREASSGPRSRLLPPRGCRPHLWWPDSQQPPRLCPRRTPGLLGTSSPRCGHGVADPGHPPPPAPAASFRALLRGVWTGDPGHGTIDRSEMSRVIKQNPGCLEMTLSQLGAVTAPSHRASGQAQSRRPGVAPGAAGPKPWTRRHEGSQGLAFGDLRGTAGLQ